MNHERNYINNSKLYWFGLGVLFLNDFFLKAIFHNWITGKLSDIVGLYLLTAFLLTVTRFKPILIEIIVFLGFIFWKAPISDFFIEWWSNYLFPISRIVDYTDLFCLIVVPLVKFSPSNNIKKAKVPMAFPLIMSLFLFTATSYSTVVNIQKDYDFDQNKQELLLQIQYLMEIDSSSIQFIDNQYKLRIKDDYCFSNFDAFITIDSLGPNKSRIHLKTIEHDCPKNNSKGFGCENRNDEKELTEVFEEKIVSKLQSN